MQGTYRTGPVHTGYFTATRSGQRIQSIFLPVSLPTPNAVQVTLTRVCFLFGRIVSGHSCSCVYLIVVIVLIGH